MSTKKSRSRKMPARSVSDKATVAPTRVSGEDTVEGAEAASNEDVLTEIAREEEFDRQVGELAAESAADQTAGPEDRPSEDEEQTEDDAHLAEEVSDEDAEAETELDEAAAVAEMVDDETGQVPAPESVVEEAAAAAGVAVEAVREAENQVAPADSPAPQAGSDAIRELRESATPPAPVPASVPEVTTKLPRGAGYGMADTILALVPNPKRPGTVAHDCFRFYTELPDGTKVQSRTVQDYLEDRRMDRRRARECIQWDLARKLISVGPAPAKKPEPSAPAKED